MSLFLPSFICVVLLFVHSYVFRGKKITLFFFISCYAMKFLKALLDSLEKPPYYYPTFDFLWLSHSGVPYGSYFFVIPIGWIFAHYTAWCIAEAILQNSPKKHDALFPIAVLSIFGSGLIGVCMEKVNEGVGWWIWGPHAKTSTLSYFGIWVLWSIMFYYFFFAFYVSGSQKSHRYAIAYIITFSFLLVMLAIFPPVVNWIFRLLVIAQIPLFFINSVKLRPMRKSVSI